VTVLWTYSGQSAYRFLIQAHNYPSPNATWLTNQDWRNLTASGIILPRKKTARAAGYGRKCAKRWDTENRPYIIEMDDGSRKA